MNLDLWQNLGTFRIRSTAKSISYLMKNPRIDPTRLFTSIVESICEAPLRHPFKPFSKYYDVIFIHKIAKIILTMIYATIFMVLSFLAYKFLPNYSTEVVLQFFYEIYQKLLIDSKVEKDEDQQKANNNDTSSSEANDKPSCSKN